MKRFIVTVLCGAVFFIGLGSLVERAGATFKSDEKALDLLRKARQAVGGDAAVAGVRSMTIVGKATKTLEIEGAARTENGDLEINFELPNKMSRKLNLGAGDGDRLTDKKVDVIVMRKADGDNVQWRTASPDNGDGVKTVTIRKKDGTAEQVIVTGREPLILKKADGDTVVAEKGETAQVEGQKVFVRRAEVSGEFEKMRSNELFRTTLSLLLSAPEGMEVAYTYVGEGSVDGTACEIIAANDGGSTVKLYLDKSTNLPRMMTFQGPKPFMIRFDRVDGQPEPNGETKIFTRRIDAPETAEFSVKFADFRSVDGLQLPHKWTQTIGGKDDEVLDITSYEINPANIAEKFKEMPTQVLMKMKKAQ